MLNTHISRYVSLHRSLGRKFSEQERLLRQYAAYAGGFGDRHTKSSASTTGATRRARKCGPP
jgi:hypothetical protein